MAPRMTRRGFIAGVVGLGIASQIPLPATARPAHRMVEGRLYCERCHAGAFPTGPRIDSNHLGVRFEDRDMVWDVRLNGEYVSDRTIESYSGRNGWVIMEAPAPAHCDFAHCPDCLGILFELRRGDVVATPIDARRTLEDIRRDRIELARAQRELCETWNYKGITITVNGVGHAENSFLTSDGETRHSILEGGD